MTWILAGAGVAVTVAALALLLVFDRR